MRIGLYDPYLNTLGGGERYILAAAACLSKHNQVALFWDDSSLLAVAEKKFALDLSNVRTAKNVFTTSTSLPQRLLATKNYDVLIYMSDGSIPWLLSKKNILLFQFPVNWVKVSLVDKVKLSRMKYIICYTDFVKTYLDKTFHRSSVILAPPVDSMFNDSVKKEKLILTVGRFTKGMNTKKQDALITAFKKMYDEGLKEWKLVVAGSYLPEDKDFVNSLQASAKGYPIEIAANIPYDKLVSYYQQAKIYWHAAGFGEDLEAHPERAEHFGITTVEAMGAGAVPVVINAGGQKEIVTDGKDGFVWESQDELIQRTKQVIEDTRVWKELSQNARSRANDFTIEKFAEQLEKLIQK